MCIYIYTYILNTCISINVNIHVYLYIYIYVYIYIYIYMCVYICINTYIYLHIYTLINACIYVYTVYIYVYMYIHVQIHMYIYICVILQIYVCAWICQENTQHVHVLLYYCGVNGRCMYTYKRKWIYIIYIYVSILNIRVLLYDCVKDIYTRSPLLLYEKYTYAFSSTNVWKVDACIRKDVNDHVHVNM